MYKLLAGSFAAIIAYYLAKSYLQLRRNIATAKQTGLAYVVVPWYPFQILWLLTFWFGVPLLEKLPKSWTEPWLQFMTPDWLYKLGHGPFEKLNCDNLLIVAPSKIHLYTASAASTAWITSHRTQFPKPIEVYRNLDLYGKNVVTLEGQAWRAHRKVTAPNFSERNNELVWEESISQARSMCEAWGAGENGGVGKTVKDPSKGTMRLALHVISRAGFGVRVRWPHEEEREESRLKDTEKQEQEMVNFTGKVPPKGHVMTYKDCLEGLLKNIFWIPLLPKWFLPKSPFSAHKTAYTSWTEFGKYMRELVEVKRAEIKAGESDKASMDLLGALVRSSPASQANGDAKESVPASVTLDDSEVIGNAFIFILAGHETTANVINFSLLFLAMYPEKQRTIQKAMDSIFGGRSDPASWVYEEDFPKVFGSILAGVMNETLRLVPAVVGIPKTVEKDRPQRVVMEGGREFTLPGNTPISLHTPGLHNNPLYWPPVPEADGSIDPNDVKKFKPERWMQKSAENMGPEIEDEVKESADLAGPAGPDTSASMFKPIKGAYVPFSEGYRSCLGRRFAQVEALAVLTYIFTRYSVELAVDEIPNGASDEAVDAMDASQKQGIWTQARDRAEDLLRNGMMTVITLQMRKGTVPIKLCARGKEKFWDVKA